MHRASLHDKMPVFIVFYCSPWSAYAPYQQLPMTLPPHIKSGEVLALLLCLPSSSCCDPPFETRGIRPSGIALCQGKKDRALTIETPGTRIFSPMRGVLSSQQSITCSACYTANPAQQGIPDLSPSHSRHSTFRNCLMRIFSRAWALPPNARVDCWSCQRLELALRLLFDEHLSERLVRAPR